jgi:FixJ family two-component response regulator
LGHFQKCLTLKQKATFSLVIANKNIAYDLAKALTIDKMHRSNQIVKICTAFAHPSF